MFLIFLILLFVLLLLLLFFEVFEELLYDVAVFDGLFVLRVDFQRFGVLFDGIFPIGLFCSIIAGGLAAADEGICEIVSGIPAQLVILGQQRVREMRNRLLKVPEFVGRGPGVELHFAGIGCGLQLLLEYFAGLVVISRLIILEAG